jgi:hypothetical protein
MSEGIFTRRVLIIIPAIYQDGANAFARQIDYAGAGDTFTNGLSADGNLPATHYWASTMMTPDQFAMINEVRDNQMTDAVVIAYDQGEQPNLPQMILNAMNLKRVQPPLFGA